MIFFFFKTVVGFRKVSLEFDKVVKFFTKRQGGNCWLNLEKVGGRGGGESIEIVWASCRISLCFRNFWSIHFCTVGELDWLEGDWTKVPEEKRRGGADCKGCIFCLFDCSTSSVLLLIYMFWGVQWEELEIFHSISWWARIWYTKTLKTPFRNFAAKWYNIPSYRDNARISHLSNCMLYICDSLLIVIFSLLHCVLHHDRNTRRAIQRLLLKFWWRLF